MMGENVIQINNLSFGYTRQDMVIKDLNLHVPNEAIYGFLGANGAGKTTTLKMILRLIRSYQGDIFVLGQNTASQYPKYLREIGSLIEHPSFYGHLSAVDNLSIWSKYYDADSSRIPQLLELLDLHTAANKKTTHFSTGMKQRLGLATALLHDPQILILDEPTNGLDPMGIIELRKVLHRLRDEGKTIILSSHILSEVERIATHLGILKDGTIIFEGTLDELSAKKEQDIEIELHVNDTNKVVQYIGVEESTIHSQHSISIRLGNKEEIPKLIKKLSDEGIKIYELKKSAKDLESMFLSISKEKVI